MNETPAPVPQKNDHTVAIMSIIATAVVIADMHRRLQRCSDHFRD